MWVGTCRHDGSGRLIEIVDVNGDSNSLLQRTAYFDVVHQAALPTVEKLESGRGNTKDDASGLLTVELHDRLQFEHVPKEAEGLFVVVEGECES